MGQPIAKRPIVHELNAAPRKFLRGVAHQHVLSGSRIDAFQPDGSRHHRTPVTEGFQNFDARPTPGAKRSDYRARSLQNGCHFRHSSEQPHTGCGCQSAQLFGCASAGDLHFERQGRCAPDLRQNTLAKINHRVGIGVIAQTAQKQKAKRPASRTFRNLPGRTHRIGKHAHLGWATSQRFPPVGLRTHVDAIDFSVRGHLQHFAPPSLGVFARSQLSISVGAAQRCQAAARFRFQIVQVQVP